METSRLISALLAVGMACGACAAEDVHPITHRRIAQVMGAGGSDWLVRPERVPEEHPDEALDALKIPKGATVADIGAGVGYFTWRLAERVGPAGTVYGEDIQREMLDQLKRNMAQRHLANVRPVLGAIDDPKLPKRSLDLVLLVDVYHEFSEPEKMLDRIRESLKPGGRLVLVEYRGEDPNVPIRPEHKMTVKDVRAEVEPEGYRFEQSIEVLPQQHMIIFTPRSETADSYLFTSFRSNGETGIFASMSADGLHWSPINGNQPWIKPEHAGMLMRDPWLGQGPDGTWHMLWTWGWTRDAGGPLRIGHASSKDLIRWSPQQEIRVMEQEPEAKNAWAPEAVWDADKKEWIIFWATTIGGAPKAYDHRVYATRTKDWATFTKSEKFFDPGYNSIDSTIVKDGDRWIMIFKDERNPPPGKRLRLAFAKSPQGPWTDVTEPFSGEWVEGPTAAHIGADWFIYFDHYTKPQHYGVMSTRDWKTFTDLTDKAVFPEGQRHGTVVRIPAAQASQLAK